MISRKLENGIEITVTNIREENGLSEFKVRASNSEGINNSLTFKDDSISLEELKNKNSHWQLYLLNIGIYEQPKEFAELIEPFKHK